MNCTVLGTIRNDVLFQDNNTKPNRNVMVFGGPGSYKTQAYTITNVFAETENSIVVTDTKGEVYESTVAVKIKQGYKPYVINFTDMLHSNRYNPLDYINRDIDATKVANRIVESSAADAKKDVWFYSQRSLLKALILYVLYETLPENRNLKGIAHFLQTYNPKLNDKGVSELDLQFEKLDIDHPARLAYDLGFKQSEGEMRPSILMSLLTVISDFVDREVGEFTSFSDFDLKDIGREKIILYVIISAVDKTFENLANLFLSQLFEQLYIVGAENHAELPQAVSFIFEEFTNLGKFTNYEEFLATCRGYGIGVSTVCQSLTQLQDKYGVKKAESILGNCAVKICLNSANKETSKYFSELLGKATVKVETGSQSVSKSDRESHSKSDSYSYTSRALMNPDEIERMPPNEAIIIFSNKRPLKVNKAFQFKLFAGADSNKQNQTEYVGEPDPRQLEIFEQKTSEFKGRKGREEAIVSDAENYLNSLMEEEFPLELFPDIK